MNFKIVIVGLLAVSAELVAQGATGTLQFIDLAGGSISPGNSITTATTFTIGDMYSISGTGVFASYPSKDFGSVTFTPSVPTSLSFSRNDFGNFVSTAIEKLNSSSSQVTYEAFGVYNSGPFDGGAIVSAPATFTTTFSQSQAGSSISDSSTFTLTTVPEPSSLALCLMSGLGGLLAFRRRK